MADLEGTDFAEQGTTTTVLHGNDRGPLAFRPVRDAELSVTDVQDNNVSAARHGFAPKAPGNPDLFLSGDGTYRGPADTSLTLSDDTVNNVTKDRHGFAPKLPDDDTVFLNGVGAYVHPSDLDLEITDSTAGDVAVSHHGFAPRLPGDDTLFLNGIGGYTRPVGGGVIPESGSFVVTASGFTAGLTGTAFYYKLGSLVILLLPTLQSTSNSTVFTISGLPAALLPTRVTEHTIGAEDNTMSIIGILVMQAGSGTMAVYANALGGSWTASGQKGSAPSFIVYALI